jgi:hypothetical protein
MTAAFNLRSSAVGPAMAQRQYSRCVGQTSLVCYPGMYHSTSRNLKHQSCMSLPEGRPALGRVERSLFLSRPTRHGFRNQMPRMYETMELGAASSGGSSWMDMPESQPLPEEPLQIFPRIKEKDPFKLLGIDREASFEEIQDARNYLYEQYKGHEPSRESIELAFDSILQSSIKFRHKYGFKPPKTGRRSDVSGDAEKISIIQRIKDAFEPNVSSVTLVNDGSIFLALALWAAWQAASSDPTLPLGAAVCFCAWKLYDKRNKRNPDGPYWGNSPIWGALLTTIGALIAGGLLSYVLAQVLPLPPQISIDAMGLFVITIGLGFTCLFLK